MMEDFNRTGELKKLPLGVWGFGFASGQLIFSRDVIAGSYLGTNNLLQLVDQILETENSSGIADPKSIVKNSRNISTNQVLLPEQYYISNGEYNNQTILD